MKVIMFVVDGLRTDFLSCYNDQTTPSTPNIDALTTAGVKFDNFIIHAPETYSSLGTLLTGKYPHKHGIGYKKLEDDSMKCFVDQMPDARMSVGLFSPFGGSVGSKYLEEVWGWRADLNITLSHEPEVSKICEWINQQEGDYFVYVYFWTMRAIGEYINEAPHIPAMDGRINQLVQSYRNLAGRVDTCVGTVMDCVGELTNEDLVVFTADHGECITRYEGRRIAASNVEESFGNAEIGHNHCRFDTVLRVPMIMAGRGIKADSTIKTQVRQIDFAPTLETLMHLKFDFDCDGVDISDNLLWGSEPVELPAATSKTSASDMQSIRYNNWKLIFDTTGMALYNLTTDPQELTNIVDNNEDVVEMLLSKIPEGFDDYVITTEDILRRYTRFDCDKIDVVATAFKNLNVKNKWCSKADTFDSKIAWVEDTEYANALSNKIVGCEKVLDAGCGTGMFLKHAKSRFGDSVELHGIDASPTMLGYAKKYGECRFGLVESMKYEDEMFDAVVCRMLLHHIPEHVNKVLVEAKRILKPSGKLILCEQVAPRDDFTDEYRFVLDAQNKEVLVVDSDTWRNYLISAGFAIVSDESIWLRQVSLDSILDNSCVNRQVKFHTFTRNRSASEEFKAAENYVLLPNGDILMDLRHLLLVGVKQ